MTLSGDDLTIVIPLWKRTHHIERVYDSILCATPHAETIFVVSDDDDPAVADTVMAVGRRCLDGGVAVAPLLLPVPWPGGSNGDYAKKINLGYRASERPFIFTGADDIDFHPEWYSAARSYFDTYKNAIGVVGTVDLCNPRTMNGLHSTHSLVARRYADEGACVDQAGVIYHEGYPHDFVDDELVQTAMARRRYAHAYLSIVEHLHPNIGKAEIDDTYRHAQRNVRIGQSRYRRRRRLWGQP